jgi:3D (Asp-Asp-Asp) domain-containing protein
MAEPLDGERLSPSAAEMESRDARSSGAPTARSTQRIGEGVGAVEGEGQTSAGGSALAPLAARDGSRVLGTFKNTYYDFPSEGDFTGDRVALMATGCKPIANVVRGFYESVCVQGSGTLKSGGTVSFARRDCECAAECPRTGQRICFDLLDKAQFPWGRGATGKPITPLVTVAVDSNVIPLGTALYVPDYDGIARDESGSALHDGCFVAEDRGLAVKGQHVDFFTGHSQTTRLWNRLVPTGKGVTIVLDSPRCKRAG